MSVLSLKPDPSEVLQFFAEIRLKVHCCRYWKLSKWNLKDMSSPFWRLYHNEICGASVEYNSKSYALSPGYVYLIPPNTSFSSSFIHNKLSSGSGPLVGSRIARHDTLEVLRENHEFDHLFVHFNLGLPYDKVKCGIYKFKTDPLIQEQIFSLKNALKREYMHIGLVQTVDIQLLILEHIQRIPKPDLDFVKLDKRVTKVISLIENDFVNSISNKDLADKVALAPNSLLRIFKENTGQGLHAYVQRRRIEESVFLMHHTNKSIDQIAQECGFCDRHHFSKAFKKQMNLSPAYYRKQLTMK